MCTYKCGWICKQHTSMSFENITNYSQGLVPSYYDISQFIVIVCVRVFSCLSQSQISHICGLLVVHGFSNVVMVFQVVPWSRIHHPANWCWFTGWESQRFPKSSKMVSLSAKEPKNLLQWFTGQLGMRLRGKQAWQKWQDMGGGNW